MWMRRLTTAMGLAAVLASWAMAYTPDSPKVRQMVAKAARFLEDKNHSALGGDCVIALALYKAGYPKSHEKIRQALDRCHKECTAEDLAKQPEKTYSHALTTIFLCEVDAQQSRPLIRQLVDALLRWQNANGSWGYRNFELGDTSQTQYCILATWAARQVGIQVPDEAFEKACRWLIRTQDPTGYWAYHGKDPGENGKRIKQDYFRGMTSKHSATAAAMGSLYMCIDALGIKGATDTRLAEQVVEIPPVIHFVGEDQPAPRRTGRRRARVSLPLLARALHDGNRWFDEHFEPLPASVGYLHYYQYSYERYRSFQEKVENRVVAEPDWYNAIVDALADVQLDTGAFVDQAARAGENGHCSTAFAILFLTRSTKKSIHHLSEGLLTGGRGLPSNDTDIRLRGGRIVSTPISRSVGDLLGLLDDPSGEEELADLLKSSVQLQFEGNATTRAKQAAQLRNLVAHQSFEARLLAVQTLGKERDLDNVPALIYALTDPDVRVVRAARDGLRFISRKLDGFGLSDTPTKEEVQRVQEKWKQWYHSIRPDASADLGQ